MKSRYQNKQTASKERKMPAPDPRPDESREDFMRRCMGDEVLLLEVPDDAQRQNACSMRWEQTRGSSEQAPPSEPDA